MVTYLGRPAPVQFTSVQLFIISNDNCWQIVNEFRKISHFPGFQFDCERAAMWKRAAKSELFESIMHSEKYYIHNSNWEEWRRKCNSNEWSWSTMINSLKFYTSSMLHICIKRCSSCWYLNLCIYTCLLSKYKLTYFGASRELRLVEVLVHCTMCSAPCTQCICCMCICVQPITSIANIIYKISMYINNECKRINGFCCHCHCVCLLSALFSRRAKKEQTAKTKISFNQNIF